jgi:ankyrin repeat protein
MQPEYDKARWFELLKSGDVAAVQNELQNYPKNFLLNLIDNSQSHQTCIFYAVQLENISRGDEMLELLLREGADPTFRDTYNQTALFYASRFGHDKQIEMLINAGCDPNHKDRFQQTALYYASREGQINTINLLISRNADVNARDELGQTAIFYACREGKFEAARALAENGANLNQADRNRQTPLSWAKKSGKPELVEYLLGKGAIDRNAKKKKEAEPKKKEEKRKTEKKQKCQLMIVDSNGDKRPATDEEIREFESKYPDIASYWKDPSKLDELENLDQDAIESFKPWEKPAKKLLNILWRTNHSWIFQEPVDPDKLGIPDYFEIVKRPMDFSTIKVRVM